MTGIRLAIAHDARTIRGRVVDPDGAPVADARIIAEGADAPVGFDTTSADAARSELALLRNHLARGPVTLRVLRDGSARELVLGAR